MVYFSLPTVLAVAGLISILTFLLLSRGKLFKKNTADAFAVLRDENLKLQLELNNLKTNEEALEKNRDLYRALAESISGITWEYDIPGDRWTYVSPQAKDILGYLPEEWIDLAWWLERLHPNDREWAPSYCRQMTARGENHAFSYRFFAKDGRTVWLNDNVSVEMINGQPAIMRGIMLDITEHKQVEEKLHQSRNMLSLVLNSVPQSVFWKDTSSTYLGCNHIFAQRAGYSNSEDIVGKTDYDLPWRPEESDAYRADDREVMEHNRHKIHIEETQKQSDGTCIWVDTTKVPLVDQSGAVSGVLGIYEDITDRKRAQEREKSQLSILEKIATNLPLKDLLEDLVHFVEQEIRGSYCSVLLANEAGTHLLHGAAPSLPDFYNEAVNGLEIRQGTGSCGTAAFLNKRVIVEKIEGHPFWKGFDPAQKAGLLACWSEPILASDKQLLGTFATYHKTPHTPGHEEIALIESAAHLASIAIERVRAEEKHSVLQEQLRQMQKIEAIGQLTGGIAHDFNNLLTPIFVYAGMIKKSFSDADPNMKKIDGLISSAHKAKELTKQLLSFSRKQVLSMSYLDLNEIIVSLQDLMRSTIRENIEIDLQLSPTPSHILADQGQIEQILVNLAVNAQDAITGNGKISLQTKQVIIGDEYAKLHPGMKSGAQVMLTFSDNGCGMNNEILSHIFEPFFTTKPVGHGTGLGLATVYGIVKQHDGYLQVQSSVGEGTTFTIYLPENKGETLQISPPGPAVPQQSRKMDKKTLMIVEDNWMVREMILSMLEPDQYKVLCADSPLMAQTIADSYEGLIDLLVTDVIMPEMSGPELYKLLTEKRPELPVLFISGYTYDMTLHDGKQDDDVNFLPKPFTTEQFLSSIHSVIHSSDI